MKISALIPSTDQVVKIENVVRLAKKSGVDEIIVAAKPGQEKKLKKLGVKVAKSRGMRGLDYNAAAKKATGDVFLLMHQNTVQLPRQLLSQIKKVLLDPSVVGGAVNIKFDHHSAMLSFVAFMSNYYRMRLRKIAYADQTIFVRKNIFRKMKGFKAMLIFEDTDFSERLNKQGRLVFLRGPVVTSSHRFVKAGVVTQTLRNQTLKLMYHLRISPKTMKKIYEFRLRKVKS